MPAESLVNIPSFGLLLQNIFLYEWIKIYPFLPYPFHTNVRASSAATLLITVACEQDRQCYGYSSMDYGTLSFNSTTRKVFVANIVGKLFQLDLRYSGRIMLIRLMTEKLLLVVYYLLVLLITIITGVIYFIQYMLFFFNKSSIHK